MLLVNRLATRLVGDSGVENKGGIKLVTWENPSIIEIGPGGADDSKKCANGTEPVLDCVGGINYWATECWPGSNEQVRICMSGSMPD